MKTFKKILFILIFGFLISLASISHAQLVNGINDNQSINGSNDYQSINGSNGASTPLPNPLGNVTTPQSLVGNIINYVLGVVGSIALIMFIYGGFTWLTSGGSAESIKKGREIIVWAAIGLIVIFLSYGLVKFLILNIQ